MLMTLLALTLAAPALKERPVDLLLLGEWVVERLTLNGQDLNINGVYIHYRFTKDGQWMMWHRRNPEPEACAFQVDLKATPHSIDFRESGANRLARRSRPGIFKLEGDRLTLYEVNATQERPRTFDVGPGSPGVFMVLKRFVKE